MVWHWHLNIVIIRDTHIRNFLFVVKFSSYLLFKKGNFNYHNLRNIANWLIFNKSL